MNLIGGVLWGGGARVSPRGSGLVVVVDEPGVLVVVTSVVVEVTSVVVEVTSVVVEVTSVVVEVTSVVVDVCTGVVDEDGEAVGAFVKHFRGHPPRMLRSW